MEITVTNSVSARRAEARVGDQSAGHLSYNVATDDAGHPVWDLYSTQVLPAFEGHGVGSRLVAAVVSDARAAGATIVPSCWFVAHWLRREEQPAKAGDGQSG